MKICIKDFLMSWIIFEKFDELWRFKSCKYSCSLTFCRLWGRGYYMLYIRVKRSIMILLWETLLKKRCTVAAKKNQRRVPYALHNKIQFVIFSWELYQSVFLCTFFCCDCATTVFFVRALYMRALRAHLCGSSRRTLLRICRNLLMGGGAHNTTLFYLDNLEQVSRNNLEIISSWKYVTRRKNWKDHIDTIEDRQYERTPLVDHVPLCLYESHTSGTSRPLRPFTQRYWIETKDFWIRVWPLHSCQSETWSPLYKSR